MYLEIFANQSALYILCAEHNSSAIGGSNRPGHHAFYDISGVGKKPQNFVLKQAMLFLVFLIMVTVVI